MKHSCIFNQFTISTRLGHGTADKNNHTGINLAERHLLISASARRVTQSGISQGNTHFQYLSQPGLQANKKLLAGS